MQHGVICRSMVDQGSVLGVSTIYTFGTRLDYQILTHFSVTVDFGLTEAAYTVVRLIQRFPTLKLPTGEIAELTGVEKQRMTLVVSSTEGCNVELR